MNKILAYVLGAIALSYGALFAALQFPIVSRTEPIDALMPLSHLAPPNQALTFARAQTDGETRMLLVTDQLPMAARAIDLSAMTDDALVDAFDALDRFGRTALIGLASDPGGLTRIYDQTELLPAANGQQHISFGTNFLDHGAEVNNETPFYFPRTTQPTASVTTLKIDPDTQMIDYEVELCMRLDRPVSSIEEFDLAQKIVFLCGDFGDRKRMLDGMPDNEKTLSGIGFTDAKSQPGYFPTGPYMVLPEDWQSFIADETVGTTLNGQSMQLTSGDQMILNFRDMAQIALSEGTARKWVHDGEPAALLPTGRIEEGQVLLSGTTEGVLFRPPSMASQIILSAKYAMTGQFLSGQSGFRSVVNAAIAASMKEKIMLMPGDEVIHRSTRLGTIKTTIE